MKIYMDYIKVTNGIFAHINYDFSPYFTLSSFQLDIMCNSFFGERPLAPIVFHGIIDDVIPNDYLDDLADMIVAMYANKWDRMGNVLRIEYDPIHNYMDQLVETKNTEEEGTVNKSGSESGSSMRTDNLKSVTALTGTDTETITGSDSSSSTSELEHGMITNYTSDIDKTIGVKDGSTLSRSDKEVRDLDGTSSGNDDYSLYGFNSTAAVNANKDVTSGTSAEDETTTLTRSDTLSGNSDTTEKTDISDETKVTGTDTTTVINSGSTSKTDATQYGKNTTTDNTGTQSVTKNSTTSSSTNTNDTIGMTRNALHTGNIGNISTQSLLNQEIQLWQWKFLEVILNDIKDFMCLPIYG